MKWMTLVENTSIDESIGKEHGLSIFLQLEEVNILFDVGASDLFVRNAEAMKIDLRTVDHLVLSHGHNDHGGGLRYFLELNTKALINVQERAFDNYYHGEDGRFIGLDPELRDNPRIRRTSGYYPLTSGAFLFSGVEQVDPPPVSNRMLMQEEDGERIPDQFLHEQNLAVEENGKRLLLCGCSHNGILNILSRYHELTGTDPDFVVGGFHLSSSEGMEPKSNLDRLAEKLLETSCTFYTCHCTGLEAYAYLKEKMGERIEYLAGGDEIRA